MFYVLRLSCYDFSLSLNIKTSHYILLLLLVLSCISFGQPRHAPYFGKCDMHIRMDYVKCLYWIESYDLILKSEPIYEGVIQEGGKIKVMQGGKHGLINCDLTTFAPIIYDKITSLYCGNKLFWVLAKGGKSALYNDQGRALTKPIYDGITLDYSINTRHVHNERYEPNFISEIPQYFDVELDGKIGIIDTTGTLIHPVKSDKIQLVEYGLHMHYDGLGENRYVWILQNDSNLQIKSLENELLYQDSTSTLDATPFFIGKNLDPILKIYDSQREKYVLFNIRSKKLTKAYAEIYANSNHQIIYSKLDQYKGDVHYYNGKLEFIYATTTNENLEHINTQQELYAIYKGSSTLIKIIDTKGKTIIQGDYSRIDLNSFNREHYLWLSKVASLEGKDDLFYYKYDVYTTEGELLNTVEYGLNLTDVRRLRSPQFFDSEVYTNYGNGLPQKRRLLFGEQNGKWGAFNAMGDIVIPFEYEEFVGEIYLPVTGNFVGYQCVKNGKTGVVNDQNETLFPFEYDYMHFNWLNTKLNYFSKNGKGTLIRFDKTVIFDDIDTIINRKFIIRADSLYCLDQNEIKLCDTSHHEFPYTSMSMGNAIIKPSGEVISISENRQLTSLTNYYLDVKDSTGYVYSKQGKRISKIKDFYLAGPCAGYLMVKTVQNKVGLRTKDGKKWLLKPNYLDIIITKDPSAYWVKTIETYGYFKMRGEWKLVNRRGKNLLGKITFSYPPVRSKNWGTAIAFVGDKFGLLNTSNEFILPPVYQAITASTTPGIYYIKKDSMWALCYEAGFTSSYYNNIASSKSLPIFKGITYTEKDTLIEIIHYEQGKWQVVAKSALEKSILNEVDLVTPLDEIIPATDEQRVNARKLWKSICYSTKYKAALIPLNNFYFLSDFKPPISEEKVLSKVLLRYVSFPDSYYGKSSLVPTNKFNNGANWYTINKSFTKPTYKAHLKKAFMYSNKGLYSEFVETHDGQQYQRNFNNFSLSNPNKTIEFYDLFVDRQTIDSFLYAYIETHVNLHQLYGSVCLNFPRVYGNYMDNFTFSKGGIKLHQKANSRNTKTDIFISYDLISIYLKPEILEIGEW
ncbi:MAG: hypothetical protein ACI8ZM_003605 [Crocinitomix sp.]|jgi:hypothetical protein